jgi:prevent-host-death family protein
MKTVTTHSAKTHLSRLLKEGQHGETVIILHGTEPVAKLISADDQQNKRPEVGEITSDPVQYSEETFAPLGEEELKEWGL